MSTVYTVGVSLKPDETEITSHVTAYGCCYLGSFIIRRDLVKFANSLLLLFIL
jgi:hypothetical protein